MGGEKGVFNLGELAFTARFEVSSIVVTGWSNFGTRVFVVLSEGSKEHAYLP